MLYRLSYSGNMTICFIIHIYTKQRQLSSMTLDSFSILALFGVTIIVGYIGYIFFDKTRIPDIFWLMIFGILIGPIFNLVDRALFISISQFLAALALIIILFDAGINMDFFKMLRSFPRSILLAVLGIAISVTAVAAVSY